jgi:hypothetical protein
MSILVLLLQALASALGALRSAPQALENSNELGAAWRTITPALTALALFVIACSFIWQIFQ